MLFMKPFSHCFRHSLTDSFIQWLSQSLSQSLSHWIRSFIHEFIPRFHSVHSVQKSQVWPRCLENRFPHWNHKIVAHPAHPRHPGNIRAWWPIRCWFCTYRIHDEVRNVSLRWAWWRPQQEISLNSLNSHQYIEYVWIVNLAIWFQRRSFKIFRVRFFCEPIAGTACHGNGF